jgi:hypothetical protein
MLKTGNLWASDHAPHRDWGGLASAVSSTAPQGHEAFAAKYPWRDNAWLVFWDSERHISAAIHCSTSFNGGQRFARAVLAHDGRVVSCDEIPDVGRLSTLSINLDSALLPTAHATGAHRVAVSTPEFEFDLTLTARWRPMDWTVLHVVPSLGEAPELNHWQQGFLATGHVRIGGQQLEFNGGGFRDRTWGWRQESGQWNELYAVNVGLEKCDISMCKFLLPDGSSKAGGFIQADDGMHEVLDSTLLYNKFGLAARIKVEAEGLQPLVLDMGPGEAGWWLSFAKPESQAPVWTEYQHLGSFDGGEWGRGYGCIPHAILRRLS